MATVSKYRGKWKCQVRKRGFPTQTRTFTTKAEATSWGHEVESQMGRGTYVVPDKATQEMTVAELLRRYLREESPHKKSGSADVYRAKPLLSALGAYNVTTLTAALLNDYKGCRLRQVAAQTVVHELTLLHRAYVVGVEDWGLILPLGIPRTRRPRLPKGRDKRVRDSDVARIVAATKSEELGVVIQIAIETAMRRGELLGLTWDRVDLEKRTALLDKTKTGSPRTVPLSRRAVALLEPRKQDDGRVFELRAMSASRAFTRAVRRAGMENIRFHDLRHEATSRLFERGLNVIEVARITGHKTLSMLDRYTHLDVRHLVDKLD
ncbi:site-specific integrase [Achromobacter xylosoxidans]|uniref:site-specific integrase n=1 Tax=Alcaligenes xylosoxydans xylosoxydans TaxID=85698 RepID=UPI0015630928|nr:site-specific integrase [Achromobacter xylosoxidans]QKI69215.1 site-specific integrase [Achromobacter xylosoxidans]